MDTSQRFSSLTRPLENVPPMVPGKTQGIISQPPHNCPSFFYFCLSLQHLCSSCCQPCFPSQFSPSILFQSLVFLLSAMVSSFGFFLQFLPLISSLDFFV